MVQASTSTVDFQGKLSQLADFLDKASRLARELSQARPFTPHIANLIRLASVPEDQEWFWTTKWQAMEQEANDALAAGKYRMFESTDELLADLHARA